LTLPQIKGISRPKFLPKNKKTPVVLTTTNIITPKESLNFDEKKSLFKTTEKANHSLPLSAKVQP